MVPGLRASQSNGVVSTARLFAAPKWIGLLAFNLKVMVPSAVAVADRIAQVELVLLVHSPVSIVPPPVRGSLRPYALDGEVGVPDGGMVFRSR